MDLAQFFVIRDFQRNGREIIQDLSKEKFIIIVIINVQFQNTRKLVGCCQMCDRVNSFATFFTFEKSSQLSAVELPTEFLRCRHTRVVAANLYIQNESESISLISPNFLTLYMKHLTSLLIQTDNIPKPNSWIEFKYTHLSDKGFLKVFLTDDYELILIAEKELDNDSIIYNCFQCPSRRTCFHRAKLPALKHTVNKISRYTRDSQVTKYPKAKLLSQVRYPYNLADDPILYGHLTCRIHDGVKVWLSRFFPDNIFQSEVKVCSSCQVDTVPVPDDNRHSVQLFTLNGGLSTIVKVIYYLI